MLGKLLSNPRFLAVYSGVLTLTFAIAVAFALSRGVFTPAAVSAAEGQRAAFDQITVHRINIVEPDGTPRLIIADQADFPGRFVKGKEYVQSDRRGYAGMLFMNDEGTENGGLIFGGRRSKDGTPHSFGHLSFDEYEEGQTLSLDTSEQGDNLVTSYQINDAANGLETPEVLAAFQKVRAMPEGPQKQKAAAVVAARYHVGITARAGIERGADKSVALRLRDPAGNTRILLRVAADGTPGMEFLDAAGKVTHKWPEN